MKPKCSKLRRNRYLYHPSANPQARPPKTLGTVTDPFYDRGAANAPGPRRVAEPARREKARAATDLRGLGGAGPPEPTAPHYRPRQRPTRTASSRRDTRPPPGPLTSQRPLPNRRPRAAPARPRAHSLPRLNAPGPRGLAPADTASGRAGPALGAALEPEAPQRFRGRSQRRGPLPGPSALPSEAFAALQGCPAAASLRPMSPPYPPARERSRPATGSCSAGGGEQRSERSASQRSHQRKRECAEE